MRYLNLLIILFSLALLTSCGTINGITAASLNNISSDYTALKSNTQKIDDMKFKAWADSACAIPLGAISRNATGNPNATEAILLLCPLRGNLRISQ